jgi:hypothetical protein
METSERGLRDDLSEQNFDAPSLERVLRGRVCYKRTYSLSVASAHYILNSSFNCCEELMNDYLATIESCFSSKHCLFCIV